MGNGWSDLVRIPFFGFLPNFFLGVGLLYVLIWTGIISCWNQLFYPIYQMGPEWAIPSWLVALFILVVVFGLGWTVSIIGDFFTLLPFQVEGSVEEHRKHVYFYDYSSSQPSKEYPTTIRYTPFRREAIHHGILWQVFKGEHLASEVAEKSFSITGKINSGLFMLALLYFGVGLAHLARQNSMKQFLLTVFISLLALGITAIAPLCDREKDTLMNLEATNEFDLSLKKRWLYQLLECPELDCLIVAVGVVWLGTIGSNSGTLSVIKLPFQLTLALLLSLEFYANAVKDRAHANALDYTHYWKLREEEARKEQEK